MSKTIKLGYIIDKGFSPIDGQPYVAIMTLKSINRKTGAMAQVWILREDVNPVDAVNTGQDVTVYGDCPHRLGKRSCYVNVGQAPNTVWKTYKRGRYIDLSCAEFRSNGPLYKIIETAVKGRSIRWGAYGDPSLINPQVVNLYNSYAKAHTGYTHQWRNEFASPFKGIFQASCDGFDDYLDATAHGWKTFTVVSKNATPEYAKQCPATVEGSISQCITCRLCDGGKTDVFVNAHGKGASYVTVA